MNDNNSHNICVFPPIQFSKKRVATLIAEQCLGPDDGKMLDVWVLTRYVYFRSEFFCCVAATKIAATSSCATYAVGSDIKRFFGFSFCM